MSHITSDPSRLVYSESVSATSSSEECIEDDAASNTLSLPQHMSFISGFAADRARWLFKAGKIDSSGNWIGKECIPPPLSSSETFYLRGKLEKALPVLQKVQGFFKKNSDDSIKGVSIKTFQLIGSYATHVLFGMPGLDEKESYLMRLLHVMGIKSLPLDGFQEAYQKEPADCDLRGHLVSEKNVLQDEFADLFKQLQKIVDPNNKELRNPFDAGFDRFGAIPIPGTICEVIVYLCLKVSHVFSADGLFLPLDSLMGKEGDAVVIPAVQGPSFCQAITDHLLGQIKLTGKTHDEKRSHLQSLDLVAFFRLWSGIVKGKVVADKGLTQALFKKVNAVTFGVRSRSVIGNAEVFETHMDHWLDKHHPGDPVSAFIYFFNLWGFLVTQLGEQKLDLVFARCSQWKRFHPLLHQENTSFIATLAKLIFREKIPFDLVTYYLQSICYLLEASDQKEEIGLSLFRQQHEIDTPIYQLKLSEGASFLFRCESERFCTKPYASKPVLFSKIERALLPHVLAFSPLGSIKQMMPHERSALLQKMDCLLGVDSHQAPLLHYIRGLLEAGSAEWDQNEISSRMLARLPSLTSIVKTRIHATALTNFVSKSLKRPSEIRPLVNVLCSLKNSPSQKEIALWQFLFQHEGKIFNLQQFVLAQVNSEVAHIDLIINVVTQMSRKKKFVRFDGKLLKDIAQRLTIFLMTRSLSSSLDQARRCSAQEALSFLIKSLVSSFPQLIASLLAEAENDQLLCDQKQLSMWWLSTIKKLLVKKENNKAYCCYLEKKELLHAFHAKERSLCVLLKNLICSLQDPQKILTLTSDLEGYHFLHAKEQQELSDALASLYEKDQSLEIKEKFLTSSRLKEIRTARARAALQKRDFLKASTYLLQAPQSANKMDYKRCLIGLIKSGNFDTASLLLKKGKQNLTKKDQALILIALVRALLSANQPIDEKLLSAFFTSLNNRIFNQFVKRESDAAIATVVTLLEKEGVFEHSKLARHKKEIENLIPSILPYIANDPRLYILVKQIYLKNLDYPTDNLAAKLWLSVIQFLLQNEGHLQEAIFLFEAAHKRCLTKDSSFQSLVLRIKRLIVKKSAQKETFLDYASSLLKELFSDASDKRVGQLAVEIAEALLKDQKTHEAFELLYSWSIKQEVQDGNVSSLLTIALNQIMQKSSPVVFASFILNHPQLKKCFFKKESFHDLVKKSFEELNSEDKKLTHDFSQTFFESLFLFKQTPFLKEKLHLYFDCLKYACNPKSKLSKKILQSPDLVKRFSDLGDRLELLFTLIQNAKRFSDSRILQFISLLDIEKNTVNLQSTSNQKILYLKVELRLVRAMLQSKKQELQEQSINRLKQLPVETETLAIIEESYIFLFNELARNSKVSPEILFELMNLKGLKKSKRYVEIILNLDVKKACQRAINNRNLKAIFLSVRLLESVFQELHHIPTNKREYKQSNYLETGFSLYSSLLEFQEDNQQRYDCLNRIKTLVELSATYLPSARFNKKHLPKWSMLLLNHVASEIDLFNEDACEMILEQIFGIFNQIVKTNQFNEYFNCFLKMVDLLSNRELFTRLYRKITCAVLWAICNNPLFSKRNKKTLILKYINFLIDAVSEKNHHVARKLKQVQNLIGLLKKESDDDYGEKEYGRWNDKINKKLANYSVNIALLNAKNSKLAQRIVLEVESKFNNQNLHKALDLIFQHERLLFEHGWLDYIYDSVFQLLEQLGATDLVFQAYSKLNRLMFKQFAMEEMTLNHLLRYTIPFQRIKLRFSVLSQISQPTSSNSEWIFIPPILGNENKLIIEKHLLLLYQIYKVDVNTSFFRHDIELTLYPLQKLMSLMVNFSESKAFLDNPGLWDLSYIFIKLKQEIPSSENKAYLEFLDNLINKWNSFFDTTLSDHGSAIPDIPMNDRIDYGKLIKELQHAQEETYKAMYS